MKYQLYPGSKNDISDMRGTVFQNRGGYSPPEGDAINDFHILRNMDVAVSCVEMYVSKDEPIDIVVDCDFDGFASASILYRYLKDNGFCKDINFHLHEGKMHGLSGDIQWREIQGSLLLVPDAGSNDIEQCAVLLNQDVPTVVLDHHLQEVDNPYAVVVNSQQPDYPNHFLCGTGVTWQFLRALNEYFWSSSVEPYLDMVALATVADNMDVTTPENRSLIDRGLAQVQHPLIMALANQAGVSTTSLTGIDAQFSIIPLVNALIRVGSMEEKELLFRAFCCFDYKKRDGEIVEESIYDRAARLCVNAKNRQKRLSDRGYPEIIHQIEENGLAENKIIVANGTQLDPSLSGLIANRIAGNYQKPCLLLRQMPDGNYSGSARNSRVSIVPNLMSVLKDTGMFLNLGGHENAFGVQIEKENIAPFIQKVNQMLPDETEPCVYADFIVACDDIDFDTAVLLNQQVRPYCGVGFDEPVFVVENVIIQRFQLTTMGNNQSSWKAMLDNDVAFVKFNVGDDDPVRSWFLSGHSDEIELNVAGTLGLNRYRGMIAAQFVISDYDVVGSGACS